MGKRNIEKHIRFTKEEYDVVCRRSDDLKMRPKVYPHNCCARQCESFFAERA